MTSHITQKMPYPASALTVTLVSAGFKAASGAGDWSDYEQSDEEKRKARTFLVKMVGPLSITREWEFGSNQIQAVIAYAILSRSSKTGRMPEDSLKFFQEFSDTTLQGINSKSILLQTFFVSVVSYSFTPEVLKLILPWLDTGAQFHTLETIAKFYSLTQSDPTTGYQSPILGAPYKNRKSIDQWLESARTAKAAILARILDKRIADEKVETAKSTIAVLDKFISLEPKP